MRHRDKGVTGEATIEFISKFKVDFGIIGISGIDADGSLLDFDDSEVRVARAIIANSHKVFLAADSTKFGRKAMVRLGRLSQVDALWASVSAAEAPPMARSPSMPCVSTWNGSANTPLQGPLAWISTSRSQAKAQERKAQGRDDGL